MTEKIALPTKECRGVDLPDAMGNPTGHVIRARKSMPGYIEVDEGPRARALRVALGSRASLVIGIGEVVVDRCECGELKFPDQDACGHCHALRADLELLAA